MSTPRIAVIGAGSWGTALVKLLERQCRTGRLVGPIFDATIKHITQRIAVIGHSWGTPW
jgi:glycerol-3-phosphate dehydrogenase